MSETSTTARPLRVCAACGQLDDHPRHQVAVAPDTAGTVPTAEFLDSVPDGTPATAIAGLMNPRIIERHIDCCAAAGCVSCQAEEAVTGGIRGQALIDARTGGALADHVAPEVTSNKELGLDG